MSGQKAGQPPAFSRATNEVAERSCLRTKLPAPVPAPDSVSDAGTGIATKTPAAAERGQNSREQSAPALEPDKAPLASRSVEAAAPTGQHGQAEQIRTASAPAPAQKRPTLTAVAAIVPAQTRCGEPDLAPTDGVKVLASTNGARVLASRRVKIPSFDLDTSSEDESEHDRCHAVQHPQEQEQKGDWPQPNHHPRQDLSVLGLQSPKRQELQSQPAHSQDQAQRQYQQEANANYLDYNEDCQQTTAVGARQKEVKTQSRSKIPSFDLQDSSDGEEDCDDANKVHQRSENTRDVEQCAVREAKERVNEHYHSLPLSPHAEASALFSITRPDATATAHHGQPQGRHILRK